MPVAGCVWLPGGVAFARPRPCTLGGRGARLRPECSTAARAGGRGRRSISARKGLNLILRDFKDGLALKEKVSP